MIGGCFNSAALQEETFGATCPQATISVSNLQVSGSISFNADMTYDAGSVRESFMLAETIPASCLFGMTCAEFHAQLQTMVNPTNGITSASCTGSETCTCHFTVIVSAMGEAGTYAMAGTSLSLTDTAGEVSTSPYCVQSNQLHIMSVDATMPTPMGQARIVSDIMAQRQ